MRPLLHAYRCPHERVGTLQQGIVFHTLSDKGLRARDPGCSGNEFEHGPRHDCEILGDEHGSAITRVLGSETPLFQQRFSRRTSNEWEQGP